MQSANTRNQYIDDHEEKGGVKLDSGRIKSAPSDGRRFTPEAVIIVSVINRHHRRLSKSSSRRHHDPATVQEYCDVSKALAAKSDSIHYRSAAG